MSDINLYNRSNRTFNPNSTLEHKPGTWFLYDEATGHKLLKMFPRDLTTGDNDQGQKSKSEIAKLKEENANLRTRVTELEDALKKAIADAEKPVQAPVKVSTSGKPGRPAMGKQSPSNSEDKE